MFSLIGKSAEMTETKEKKEVHGSSVDCKHEWRSLDTILVCEHFRDETYYRRTDLFYCIHCCYIKPRTVKETVKAPQNSPDWMDARVPEWFRA